MDDVDGEMVTVSDYSDSTNTIMSINFVASVPSLLPASTDEAGTFEDPITPSNEFGVAAMDAPLASC
ncbi:MAG: WD40 repeat protein [Candidatus Aldehydirespiratoraceae bacterium]